MCTNEWDDLHHPASQLLHGSLAQSLAGFDFPNAQVKVYGVGYNKIAWIGRSNVAEYAVQSLDHLAAHNAVLEMGGP
jgi:hypothetical protein